MHFCRIVFLRDRGVAYCIIFSYLSNYPLCIIPECTLAIRPRQLTFGLSKSQWQDRYQQQAFLVTVLWKYFLWAYRMVLVSLWFFPPFNSLFIFYLSWVFFQAAVPGHYSRPLFQSIGSGRCSRPLVQAAVPGRSYRPLFQSIIPGRCSRPLVQTAVPDRYYMFSIPDRIWPFSRPLGRYFCPLFFALFQAAVPGCCSRLCSRRCF